jgi:hypothetical protein
MQLAESGIVLPCRSSVSVAPVATLSTSIPSMLSGPSYALATLAINEARRAAMCAEAETVDYPASWVESNEAADHASRSA